MTGLLRASSLARELTKRATHVPDIPGLTGGTTPLSAHANGVEGRLQYDTHSSRDKNPKPRRMQAKRAYGPRVKSAALSTGYKAALGVGLGGGALTALGLSGTRLLNGVRAQDLSNMKKLKKHEDIVNEQGNSYGSYSQFVQHMVKNDPNFKGLSKDDKRKIEASKNIMDATIASLNGQYNRNMQKQAGWKEKAIVGAAAAGVAGTGLAANSLYHALDSAARTNKNLEAEAIRVDRLAKIQKAKNQHAANVAGVYSSLPVTEKTFHTLVNFTGDVKKIHDQYDKELKDLWKSPS